LEQARKAGRSWARNLAALGDAIEKGDAKFRYDPGTLPGDLQVFVPPE
jgi:hypothetical protein